MSFQLTGKASVQFKFEFIYEATFFRFQISDGAYNRLLKEILAITQNGNRRQCSAKQLI